MDYIKNLHDRLTRREETLKKRIEKVRRWVDAGKIGGEEDRYWLAEQVKGLKYGLDICAGDFPIKEEAIGIDTDWHVIGAEFTFFSGDELSRYGGQEVDYIVSNHVEAFPNPLKLFNEWHRVLKPGGVIAFVCADADKYQDNLGPFCNKHRLSIYTKKTVKNYLTRAGFVEMIILEGLSKSIRVKAYKP